MDDIVMSTPSITSSLKPISKVAKQGLVDINSLTKNVSTSSTINTNTSGWSTKSIISLVLIFIVLGLLGLNIFTYLAKGTDMITYILSNFINKIPETTKDVLENTLQGVDLGTDIASSTIKDTTGTLERELNLKGDKLWDARDKGIKKSIDNREIDGINEFPEHEPGYTAGPDDDRIQEKRKPGYCYIGTDRGYRSCIKVGKNDDCVSKKIFPTMDICINPSLRE
jgi:hypothetical protein